MRSLPTFEVLPVTELIRQGAITHLRVVPHKALPLVCVCLTFGSTVLLLSLQQLESLLLSDLLNVLLCQLSLQDTHVEHILRGRHRVSVMRLLAYAVLEKLLGL